MGGGRNGIAMAPLMPPSSFPRSRATMAWADCDSLRRSSYGLRRRNRIARLGAGPEKLKPVTVKAAAKSGSVSRIFSACDDFLCFLPLLSRYSSWFEIGFCLCLCFCFRFRFSNYQLTKLPRTKFPKFLCFLMSDCVEGLGFGCGSAALCSFAFPVNRG